MTGVYRSGLMLAPPLGLGGHAFTPTRTISGQWTCHRCHIVTHTVTATITAGRCTGTARALNPGEPNAPRPIQLDLFTGSQEARRGQ